VQHTANRAVGHHCILLNLPQHTRAWWLAPHHQFGRLCPLDSNAQPDVGKITAQNTHLTTASPTQPPHGESARHPALHSHPTPSRHEPAYARG
jgi:hypothetical protein